MIGTKLAHFTITAHLGSGGMGDLYQATDSKLGRSVAIKLLPEAFTHDTDRAARFEREARVLASLNHPNIAAIYGVEESGGRKFLVMELVPGDTLAERIKRGPIPVDESLGIAKHICEALEEAHEKGVIHRDLKLANITVTPEGKVKVLDFGLAKAYAPDPANANMSNSPTLSMAATNAGVILGTAAYMSPEQAKGRTVDKRTGIFAFGAVLYEMLTGRPAFDGDDVGEILARVIEREPDWSRLPAKVPPRIHELLRRCLEKNVKNRRSDAADVRIDIEEALAEPAATQATPPARSSRLARVAFAVAVLGMIALAIPTVRHVRERSPPSPPEMRLEITTPPTADPVSLAISPEGQKIVFVATEEGRSRLSLRSLDSVSARPLTGTEGASWPFWSPDGRSVGFFADGKLKRIDVDGGQLQNLTDAPSGRGASWNRDGTIIFTPDFLSSPIFRIPAAGGEPSPLTRPESPKQTSHRFPQFLPDGRHFLYYVQGVPESRGVYIGDLQGSQTQRLLDADSAAVYAAPGRLLFVRQGTLFAQDFDSARLELRGNASPVAQRIALSATAQGSAAVSRIDGRPIPVPDRVGRRPPAVRVA